MIRKVFGLALAATLLLSFGLFLQINPHAAFAAPQQQGAAGDARGWAILYEEDP